MNFDVKSVPFAAGYQGKNLSIGKTKFSINRNTAPPIINRKIQAPLLKCLMPLEILAAHWSRWNEPDLIKYRAANGESYIVQDENLLGDVCKFMEINGYRGLHPYIHVEGEHEWKCFPAPSEEHLLEYLRAYNCNYDIYTGEGQLIREANSEKRKFNLNVQFQ